MMHHPKDKTDITMISATLRSDDGAASITFDATPWFEQASDREIIDLANCGWGGDYAADDVSHFFSGSITAQVFDYLDNHPARETNSAIGHETHVDMDEAVEWIIENRPQVAQALGGTWSPKAGR
jgi:hypothetical protein